MPDSSDHITAISPAGTVHALKEDEPKTLCGRPVLVGDGWAYSGPLEGTWDTNFPPPYEHEAACTICSHNYEQKHA